MSYTAEIDAVDEYQWHRQLKEFDDANIFQTWAYGAARWGESNLSHALIRENGEVVGLAQTSVVQAPLFGKILGYVVFGPIWQRRSSSKDIGRYMAIVRALREEYVKRRGLCLRLRPWRHNSSDDIRQAMLAEGNWDEMKSLYETYVLDLSHPLTELYSNMDRRWRSNLRRAQQYGLSVSEERAHDAIGIFSELSRQMQHRKRFVSHFLEMFPAIHEALPMEWKPQIFVCWHNNQPVASAIVSVIGDKAFYLNGASGDSGLDVRGGYFLQWEIVRWLKQRRLCRWYDLYGVLSNPGVRQFKRGLIGAKAQTISMNDFQTDGNFRNALITKMGASLHSAHRKLRPHLNKLKVARTK